MSLESTLSSLEDGLATVESAINAGSKAIAIVGGEGCDIFGTAGSVISDSVKQAAKDAESAVADILKPLTAIGTFIKETFNDVKKFVQDAIKKINELTLPVIAQITAIVNNIKDAFNNVASQIQNAVNSAIASVKGALDNVLGTINETIGTLQAAGCKAMQGAIASVTSSTPSLDTIANATEGLGSAPVENLGLASSLSLTGDNITLDDLGSAAVNSAKDAANAASGEFNNIGLNFQSGVSGDIDTLRSLVA